MTDIQVIHGPTAGNGAGGVIYQVTLARGMVLTNPQAFGSDGCDIDDSLGRPGPVIAEDGSVLRPRG